MASKPKIDLAQILAASTQILDWEGASQLTLASLAKKLGIRSPSLYNHVEGLPGLQEALALEGLKRLYEELSCASSGKSRDEAIHGLSEAYMSFVRTHPGLYEATFWGNAGTENPEVAKISTQIVDLLVQILKGYDLTEEQALHVTRGLRSILHGFASLEQKKGFGMPMDVDVSIRLLLDTILAGFETLKKKDQ